MSVIKFGLRSGTDYEVGKITEHKGKLTWLAVTDNNLDTEQTVAQYGYSHSLLPIPYLTTFRNDPLALCRGVSFTQDPQAPRKWTIVAIFSSAPLKQADQTQAEDPLSRPAKAKWRSQQYRKAIDADRDGNAIVNSAGDYFDPPVEIDQSHWTVTVTKNVSSVPTFILGYTDGLNADGFAIQGVSIGAGVAKLMDLDVSELQIEGEVAFYIFTYTMELRPETWQLSVLDQGFRYVSGDDVKLILDDSTPPRAVTSPKLLDGEGAVLSDPSPSTAVFLDFDVYPEVDYSVLPGITEIEE